MSDFDTVLERLLVDPGFKAQLAADPDGALAAYQLDDDERGLLRAQVTGDTGGNQRVEQRTSKASLFGLLSPMAGIGGLSDTAVHGGIGHGNQGLGVAGPGQGLGLAGPDHGLGVAGPAQGLSEAGAGGTQGLSAQDVFNSVHQSLEHAAGGGGVPADDEHGGLLGRNFADFGPDDPLGHGSSAHGGMGVAPVDNYHTRVDVEGDGKWDAHTYAARDDGGVDIIVDANHDGKADFVGIDHDRDGLIDESYVDYNHDGVMDAHYVDNNHDGWLDKKVPIDKGQGTYVSRHAAVEPDDDGLSAR